MYNLFPADMIGFLKKKMTLENVTVLSDLKMVNIQNKITN